MTFSIELDFITLSLLESEQSEGKEHSGAMRKAKPKTRRVSHRTFLVSYMSLCQIFLLEGHKSGFALEHTDKSPWRLSPEVHLGQSQRLPQVLPTKRGTTQAGCRQADPQFFQKGSRFQF